ncbi:unnamed protein product [Amoebophrya sp. A25]|nr:unnamed protein product [Amoebophrya sp. A25]|eukprot:GSA25T00018254001.1
MSSSGGTACPEEGSFQHRSIVTRSGEIDRDRGARMTERQQELWTLEKLRTVMTIRRPFAWDSAQVLADGMSMTEAHRVIPLDSWKIKRDPFREDGFAGVLGMHMHFNEHRMVPDYLADPGRLGGPYRGKGYANAIDDPMLYLDNMSICYNATQFSERRHKKNHERFMYILHPHLI